MNGRKLQDRIYLGLGKSGRAVGQIADAFRPSGPANPLALRNRFLRLPIAFVPASGDGSRTNVYGDPLWHGLYDASYTRAGDYLVVQAGIYFVASQEPLLPILCVRANRTISISRPDIQSNIASNSYGGYTTGSCVVLMKNWPASILTENKASASGTDLPTDQAILYWEVLAPSPTGVLITQGDILTDDLGRTAIVVGSEQSNLGWRLTVKMATT